MAGLLDIAPASETLNINGTEITVSGIASEDIATLFRRFPEIRMMLTGKKPAASRVEEMGMEALGAIIAAGIGFPGDKEQEAAAARLTPGIQLDLLSAVMRTTMPGGVRPFMERLAQMANGAAAQ